MRILHFATDDITGGAAKASYRLHTALREAGHQSRLIVRYKKSDDTAVLSTLPPPPRPWAARWERWRQSIPGLQKRELKANYTFNFDYPPPLDPQSLFPVPPDAVDVICLHWITGLLDVRSIRRLYDYYHCPLLWIPADQEAVTGGCHYSFGCDGFTKQCGCCPQLDSHDPHDHTHKVWQRKRQYLVDLPLYFIAPTSWIAARIRESSLFREHRVEWIPYAIDTSVFRPFEQSVARDSLQLPQDKKIIFFGATYLEDRRKGMENLLATFEHLWVMQANGNGLGREEVFLLVAGLNGKGLLESLPFAGKYVGQLNNDLTLALAYQAADVFLCPSVEDAGPMMIPEAMLCGTPVVAFNTGGAPDVICHLGNGYLAATRDDLDLAAGLHKLLVRDSLEAFRQAAREAAIKLHAPQLVAQRYLEFCQSL